MKKYKHRKMSGLMIKRLAAVIKRDQDKILQLHMGVKRLAAHLEKETGYHVSPCNIRTLMKHGLVKLDSRQFPQKKTDPIPLPAGQPDQVAALTRRVESLEGEVAVAMRELLRVIDWIDNEGRK